MAGDGSRTAVRVNLLDPRPRLRRDEDGEPHPAELARSHQVRWLGENDSSGRSRSRRNGPSAAAASASAACRRSRGSSRSMFIANASSATSSSHAASRPSATGRNASTAAGRRHRRRGTASAATSARSCSATTGRTGAHPAGSRGRSRPGRWRDATPCATRSPDSRPRARSRSRAPCRRARRGRSRRRGRRQAAARGPGALAATAPPAGVPCCISRREARRSGWSPSGSSRAGNASRNPATQRARSRTVENTPPIDASAPYGSVPSRISPLSRRT